VAEKVFVKYLLARVKDISQKGFCKEFRNRYEGVRSEDVEFISRVMVQSLRSSELMAKKKKRALTKDPLPKSRKSPQPPQ
jgi:hypothetical protein